MQEYPTGWSETYSLEHRFKMYREYSQANPEDKKVGDLVTLLLILQILWSLAALIYYLIQIDDLLLAKTNDVSFKRKISPELAEYLNHENARRNKISSK